jgi:hypothetical protein
MDVQAPMAGLVIEQFTDIFRIGMILFLVITSANTAHATPTRAGRAAPLVLGVLFIAVLIPVSFSRDAPDLLPRILLGIPVNAIWLAIMLALVAAWKRFRS